MDNDQFPFLIMDQNKNNNDNPDNDIDFSSKNFKKFKLNKFEKFKPKNENNPSKNNQNLKGAENKVKSLLSFFLKDIEQENENPANIDKSNYHSKINQNEITPKKFKRKSLKRNSASEPNLHFGKINFNKSNFGLNNNLHFNINKNINNNINIEGTKNYYINKQMNDEIKDNSVIKSKLFKSSIKRGSSLSIKNQNIKKKKNSKDITDINNSNLINDNNEAKRKKNNKYKRLKTYSKNKSNTSKILKIGKNLKNNLYDINPKKTFESKNSKQNKNPVLKKNKTLFPKNIFNMNENIKVNNNKKDENIKIDEIINKKSIKKDLSSKSFKKNKYDNLNNKNKKVIFNEPSIVNNSIISEGSECNLNQKSMDDEIIKFSASPANKKMQSSLNKKKLLTSLNLIKKDSIINNNEKDNAKYQSEIKSINSNISNDKKKSLNKKLRSNTRLKTIKKQLKKSLIIRPEDIKLNINNIKNSKVSGSSINLKKVKNNKSKSGTSIFKINSKNLNLDIVNKTEISGKNNSNLNNIIIPIPKLKNEKITKNEEEKKTEQEKKEIEKDEMIFKEDSGNEIHSNSGKRYNDKYYQKYRRLIHRKIVYDSLDDEEFEDVEDINSVYLHPNSNFVIIFDSLLFITGTISFVMSPLYLAQTHDFCRSPNFSVFSILNIFIELLNILDVFLGFFRGYYNWEEQLIHRNKIIIKKYLTGWFLFDLMAAAPIYSMSKIQEPYCNDYELSSTYYNVILDKMHYMLLCNRLFKVFKIFSFNQAWKILSNKLNDSSTMIIYIFFILFSLNYAGCLYIFIARNCYPNWILNTGLETSSFLEIYICSIYILIMAITTVGYGDITCYSFHERIFQLILLVGGIMAYSWVVSSFSNYVKKINERTADYEKKKSILDEIKLNSINLPEELYEKILKYLKFKNFHEKEMKNIIFDCLPVSLKNSLICEMYKPIIQNFIFFKNFQNTDFIVRVILAFKPVMAYKNDVLINDSDMVDDIMFVKQGVLSVELPINMSNPQENVDKYLNISLNGPNSNTAEEGKFGNTLLLNNLKNSKFKSTIGFQDYNKNLSIKKTNFGYSTFASGIDSRFNTSTTFGNKQTTSENKKEKIKLRYIRILCIRENEHFGDVMMFLEQRSPLRVRVKSKKCELFFLKKMEAIKISTSYPNIWRRINKKSVFNFEQIKKSINKIVEIYCHVKQLNSIDEEESSDIYNDLIKQNKNQRRKSVNDIMPKNYDYVKNIKEDNKLVKTKSLNNENNQLITNILKKNNSENLKILNKDIMQKNGTFISEKNNNKLKLSYNIKNKSEFSSSLSSLDTDKKKNKGKNKKLINTYNGNYKFYKNLNNDIKSKDIIIREEPENEYNQIPIKSAESFKTIKKYNLSSKNRKKTLNNINKNNLSVKSIKTIKLEQSSSIKYIKDENFKIFENSEKSSSNNFSYDNIINKEIHSEEEIKINKEEDLLSRKIHFSYPFKTNFHYEIYNKYEIKNNKLLALLRTFDENENNIKYNESNNLLDLSSNRNSEKKKKWGKNFLSINNIISFKYKSSYENCNLISGEKLIKYKRNQEKLKKFLIEEILNSNSSNDVDLMKNKTSNFISQNQSGQKKRTISSSNIFCPHTPQITHKQGRKIISSDVNLLNNSLTLNRNINTNSNNNDIKRTTSYNEIIANKNKKIKNSFQEDLNNYNSSSHFAGKKLVKIPRKKILSSKAALFNGLSSSSNEIKKKSFNKLSPFMLSPIGKPKKKRGSLLSKINLNIMKTNQNLNNPEQFYSNYFNSLLEGDIAKSPLFNANVKNISKQRKDKNNGLLKNVTRKNSK